MIGAPRSPPERRRTRWREEWTGSCGQACPGSPRVHGISGHGGWGRAGPMYAPRTAVEAVRAPCGYLARWVGSGPASGYWLAVAACWASCASQSPPAIGGRRERRLQRSSRERWIASPSRPGRVAVGAGWCGSPGQATAPGLRCGGVTVSRRRRGRGQAALMDRPMVGPAQQRQVVEVGGAAVEPVAQMMGLAPGQASGWGPRAELPRQASAWTWEPEHQARQVQRAAPRARPTAPSNGTAPVAPGPTDPPCQLLHGPDGARAQRTHRARHRHGARTPTICGQASRWAAGWQAGLGCRPGRVIRRPRSPPRRGRRGWWLG
jgi:hypothetical protein